MNDEMIRQADLLYETMEIPIWGMDCADCTRHVQKAISALEGVESVDVLLAAEKAVISLDPQLVGVEEIRLAVEGAGYAIGEIGKPAGEAAKPIRQNSPLSDRFTRPVLTLLGVVFGAVLFVVVAGEWLGLFEAITQRVPWPVGLAVVLIAGYPVFRNVLRATLRGQVISHTLMTLGVLAALAVGEWATAVVVVFFMRVGDYAEHFTTERARRAAKGLSALAPQMARVERQGVEVDIPVVEVKVGEVVIVRPGEIIPVDGEVVSGQATINRATITGEAMPVEAGSGSKVYASTLAQNGSLRVRTTQTGPDTTFGRVIRLVEEAEVQRGDIQRVADRFSAYYLPVVAGIAALTFIIRRDPLATAAVLVVACSCSFALATPIAILASIGAAAKRGLMIKGGKYLELLAQADVMLIDKTGTLTLGKPQITDIEVFEPEEGILPTGELSKRAKTLRLAASAERYSEHPLAEAVRAAAREEGLELAEPVDFQAQAGVGVRARVLDGLVEVGSRRLLESGMAVKDELVEVAARLEGQGKTLLFVAYNGKLVGLLAAADTLRPEVPQAIAETRWSGIREVELLTGDNEQSAQALVGCIQQEMGDGSTLRYRANLLPEDKIEIVRAYQAQGRRVVMVGDGVNDAPALAQADVGIAMGAAGSDVAIEAAHVALMLDDWRLVPEVLRIAHRTMRVVKSNIAFTAVYNLVGLSLAALGILPPIFAAAAQSLPDLGILANSSRLLRQ
ncbi:MAG: cation-translocating P-type ATPase [Anaerolineales bacterium]|nr:cation-translocating P-type ATPase [Anaerolineales bacterium]